MLRILRKKTAANPVFYWWGGRCLRNLALFPTPEALEQPCVTRPSRPYSEPILEPRIGTPERERLCQELTALCNYPPIVSITVGAQRSDADTPQIQPMPFQHERAAAYYYRARPDTVKLATQVATCCQRGWERRSVDERCGVLEKAAQLIAGDFRQRIVAAAMIGQGMTAIQAEYNICQLVDYIRYGCAFMRDLTKSRCVVDGGKEAHNRNQYHGLEGFWAAITPCDSFALASQLAITPVIMGNGVVWKPSDHAVLACHRVFECLQTAGLPPGVLNFVPAEENQFLNIISSDCNLAGVSFAGTTSTLEHIWDTINKRIKYYARFPRIVGTGSGKNFHVVHSSASLPNAVSCTARAAFEMAGQKSMSCSRVFVAHSVLDQFLTLLQNVTKTLFVCQPLDYRCFMSSLVSRDAYRKVTGFMERAAADSSVRLICGGRHDDEVGYYVEPTVYLVQDPSHELLCREVRGPLLAVCPFSDYDGRTLEQAVAQAPYAITGSIFAQEPGWAHWAVGALRDLSATLAVNERCSEERPAQQSVGGTRKSGTGAKAGSISYLLHFCTERSLREALQLSTDVTYRYMDEVPPELVIK